ncbi:hypothetical protein [Celeribacter sp. ULVN23_4]
MQDVLGSQPQIVRRKETALWGLTIATFFAAYTFALGAPMFRLDDAYIVLHNADALFNADKNFPGTPALYGSTSLLHTLAAAVAGQLFGPEAGLMVLSWFAIGLYVFGILEMARQAGLSLLFRTLVTATALTTGDLVQVFLNGLETVFAMAVISWTIVLHLRGSRWLPVLAALAPFVRPELFLLSAFIMGDLLLKYDLEEARFVKLRPFATFSVIICILLLVQFVTSGGLLPATGEAKKIFFGVSDADAWEETSFGISNMLRFLSYLMPQPLFVFGLFRRRYSAYLFFILALLLYYVVFQPNIIGQNFFRYMYVLLPFFTLGGIALIASRTAAIRMMTISLFIAALALNMSTAVQKLSKNMEIVRQKHETLVQEATWIKQNLSPSDTVLVHDVGYIAFATDQSFFDMVGLKSPPAVEINARFAYKQGAEGRGEALAEMARLVDAKAMLVSTGWNRNQSLTAPLAGQGWTLSPHPGGNPAGLEAYILTPPEK